MTVNDLELIKAIKYHDSPVSMAFVADRLAVLLSRIEELEKALEWYASEGDGERFQIVDDNGEVIANFSTFGDRARAALANLKAGASDEQK